MKARQKKRRQWRYLASLPNRWTANELAQARARARAIVARLQIADGVATDGGKHD